MNVCSVVITVSTVWNSRIGEIAGRITCRNRPNEPALFTLAASSCSAGTVCSAARSMMMPEPSDHSSTTISTMNTLPPVSQLTGSTWNRPSSRLAAPEFLSKITFQISAEATGGTTAGI